MTEAVNKLADEIPGDKGAEGPIVKEISWNNIKWGVSVKEEGKVVEKQILKGVSGSVSTGRLLAVMGSSGSGKTSLLNIIAGRTLDFKGDLLLDGDKLDNVRKFGKCCAYVQQQDLFYATNTVEEHLTFLTNILSLDKSDKEMVLQKMNLVKSRNTMIGSEMVKKGLSGGEKKRLAVGCELMFNPQILLMDEPTSGLDSQYAADVIKITKKLCKEQARVCFTTIHQPGSYIYGLFDDLCLLASGYCVYIGTREGALDWFAMLGYACPSYSNPADHWLYLLTVGFDCTEKEQERVDTCIAKWQMYASNFGGKFPPANSSLEDVANKLGLKLEKTAVIAGEEIPSDAEIDLDAYATASTVAKSGGEVASSKVAPESPPRKAENVDLVEVKGAPNGASKKVDLLLDRKPGVNASYCKQIVAITKRLSQSTKKEPLLFKARIGQAFILIAIISLIYWRLEINNRGVQNMMGAMFFITVQSSFSGMMGLLNTFPLELPIVFREVRGGLYNVGPYFFSKQFVELPIQMFTSLLMSSVIYFTVGFEQGRDDWLASFSEFNFALLLTGVTAQSLGYFISALVPTSSPQLAMILGPTAILPQMLLGGFLMNVDTIPVWAIWLEKLSFMRYGYEMIVVTVFTDLDVACEFDSAAQCPYSNGKDVLEYLGFDEENRTLNYCMLVVLLVFYRTAAFLVILRKSMKQQQ